MYSSSMALPRAEVVVLRVLELVVVETLSGDGSVGDEELPVQPTRLVDRRMAIRVGRSRRGPITFFSVVIGVSNLQSIEVLSRLHAKTRMLGNPLFAKEGERKT